MKIRRLPVGAVVVSLLGRGFCRPTLVDGNAPPRGFRPDGRSHPGLGLSERATGKRKVLGPGTGLERAGARYHQNPPTPSTVVILIIDLSGVSGTGSSSEARYASGVMEPPYSGSSPAPIRSRSLSRSLGAHPWGRLRCARASASFALSFDTNTGAITKGTATVAAPNFPN